LSELDQASVLADISAALEAAEVLLPLEIPTSPAGSMGEFRQSPQVLVGIPEALRLRIQTAGKKPRQATVRELLRDLCALRAYTALDCARCLAAATPANWPGCTSSSCAKPAC